MAPRRAAAISAASNMAASAASASSSAGPSHVGAASSPRNGAKGGRKSTGGAEAAAAGGDKSSNAAQSNGPNALLPPRADLSPIIARLRTMWKFAAICQFLFTFDEAFGMSGFESDAFERDLDGTETRIVPDLMRRLLYTLTLNRTIDESNWETHLRAQYNRRDPENSILGNTDTPISWHALSLPKKIDTIHTLCEWQLWDAERFRKLVKNDEDAHVWRIDPIGWDGQDNTYWLFDDNRLWVQHPPPAPKPQPKAKAPPKKSSKKAKAEARREAKRKREAANASSASGRPGTGNQHPAKRARPSRGTATGIESSRADSSLISGVGGDDEDGSDLSDPPSDEEFETSIVPDGEVDVKMEDHDDVHINGVPNDSSRASRAGEEDDDDGKLANDASDDKGPQAKEEDDWIEFEAVAVGRPEWEWYAKRFAKSRHPDEKALHALLQETVLPKVMADLEEAEKQRALEAAMANRKRSSRIALKESEREEKERDRIARIKMEEKMAAIREEEETKERKEREEFEATRLREERLREREERVLAREREAMERAERDIFEREERERLRELRKLRREQGLPDLPDEGVSSASTPGAAIDAASEDNWELDCEVCGRHGINLDDAQELVCCETCGVWQHTECWNAFDRSTSQPRRNWEVEDFYCSKCRPPAPGQPWPKRPTPQGREPATSFSRENSSMETPPPPVPILPSQGQPPPHRIPPALVEKGKERDAAQQSPQSFMPRPPVLVRPENSVQSQALEKMGPPQPSVQQAFRSAPTAQPPGVPSQEMCNIASSSPASQVQGAVSSPVRQVSPHTERVQGVAKPLPTIASAASGDLVPRAETRPQSFSNNINGSSPTPKTQQQDAPLLHAPAQSPSPKMSSFPLRSPQSSSAAATSSVPRNVASQPSGSFPLRHMSARSPLSGPHTASPPMGMQPMSIGPPLQRASSPSPSSRAASRDGSNLPGVAAQSSGDTKRASVNGTLERPSNKTTPTIEQRPVQLGFDLLHSRQLPNHLTLSTPASTKGPAPSSSGFGAAAFVPSSSSADTAATSQSGPGPAQGSLARTENPANTGSASSAQQPVIPPEPARPHSTSTSSTNQDFPHRQP